MKATTAGTKTTMGLTGIRGFWEDSKSMEASTDAALPPIPRFGRRVLTFVLLAVLDINLRLIRRFRPNDPAVWPNDTFDWVPQVEAGYDIVRKEVEAYVAASAAPMPHVADLAGLDLETERGGSVVLNDQGAWRGVVIYMGGQWIEETASLFPETVALLRDIPRINSIGFTGLDPHSHIEEHVGPNKGALRYQLPILVPGEYGDARIRIVDQMVPWVEGESLIFDLAVNHEAWNDSDGFRVLLNLEAHTPLPQPLDTYNRLIQWFYRYHPSHRGLGERTGEIQRRRAAQRPTA